MAAEFMYRALLLAAEHMEGEGADHIAMARAITSPPNLHGSSLDKSLDAYAHTELSQSTTLTKLELSPVKTNDPLTMDAREAWQLNRISRLKELHLSRYLVVPEVPRVIAEMSNIKMLVLDRTVQVMLGSTPREKIVFCCEQALLCC